MTGRPSASLPASQIRTGKGPFLFDREGGPAEDEER